MAQCKNCVRLFKIQDEESDMFGDVWCDKIFDNPDVEREHNCAYYKTMTNGDRIRKMTDEELAQEFGLSIEWLKELHEM